MKAIPSLSPILNTRLLSALHLSQKVYVQIPATTRCYNIVANIFKHHRGHYDHLGALRSYVINMSTGGRLSGHRRALQVSPYGYRALIRLLDFRNGGF